MDFLGIGIDRYDGRFGVALADRTREVFLDRDELVEIDPAALVDDAEAAHAEDFLEPPFPQDGAGRQCLVAVRLGHQFFGPNLRDPAMRVDCTGRKGFPVRMSLSSKFSGNYRHQLPPKEPKDRCIGP